RAVDLVVGGEPHRAARLALDAEGLDRGLELLLVDALLLQPGVQLLGLVGAQAIAVDGVEEGPVDLVEDAHGLEGVEDRGVVAPALVEDGGHAAELDVLGQRLQPRLDARLEVVAVDAAVPEELEHLDLARGLDGLRRVELHVRRRAALRERCRPRGGEEGSDQTSAYGVHCWSFTLIRLASIPFCASAWRTLLISSSFA